MCKAVTSSISNKRKTIPVLEAGAHPKTTDTVTAHVLMYQNQRFLALVAGYSEDSKSAHTSLYCALLDRHCKHKNVCAWKCWVYYLHPPSFWLPSSTVPEKYLGHFLYILWLQRDSYAAQLFPVVLLDRNNISSDFCMHFLQEVKQTEETGTCIRTYNPSSEN